MSTPMSKQPYRVSVFQGRGTHPLWYWRVKSRNGRIVATGGEGYVRRSGAMRAARRLCQNSPPKASQTMSS